MYEVRPRKDKRGVDLISDALPFGKNHHSANCSFGGSWLVLDPFSLFWS